MKFMVFFMVEIIISPNCKYIHVLADHVDLFTFVAVFSNKPSCSLS
jgi:hypothetical protein